MSGGRVLVTQDGVLTVLEWWSILKLDGLEIMLVPQYSDDESSVIIARGATEDEAKEIYRALSRALRIGVRLVDVAPWQTFAGSDENGRGAEIRHLTE